LTVRAHVMHARGIAFSYCGPCPLVVPVQGPRPPTPPRGPPPHSPYDFALVFSMASADKIVFKNAQA